MKTTKKENASWIRWNEISDKDIPWFGRQYVGRWQYNYKWKGMHASLVQIKSSFTDNLEWEIWVRPMDDDPMQCGSRNDCLHYMYRRMLGLDDGI